MTWWLCPSFLAFTLMITSVATALLHSGPEQHRHGRKFKVVVNVSEENYSARGKNQFPGANLVSNAVSDNCFPCPRQPRWGGDDVKNCTIVKDRAFCSSLGLSSVPWNLPKTIITLDLENNSIIQLPDCVFNNYSMLEYLNMSHNRLATLSNCSFYKLANLKNLNLNFNSLVMPSSYPNNVFCPLRSLLTLRLNENTDSKSQSYSYPDKALSCLFNLTSLHMDGLPVNRSGPFGEGFKHLTQLSNLTLRSFRHRCKLDGLHNNTFQNIPNLQHLDVSYCSLSGLNIQAGALEPLRNLRLLNISYNWYIGWENMNKIFFGLQNATSLTHLSMNAIHQRYAVGICLDYSLVKYFPQTITHLEAQDNNLEAVDPSIVSQLGLKLENLYLGGNRLTLGAYLIHLADMKELKSLSLSNFYDLAIPKQFPRSLEPHTHVYSNCTTFISYEKLLYFILPPNLITLEMSNYGLRYILSDLTFKRNNSLQKLTLNGNYFPHLKGTIYGLHSLQTLELSSCSIKEIATEFFQKLTSLQALNLDCNNLGEYLSRNENNNVFSKLHQLISLNLSNNDIYTLPANIFLSLIRLSELYLMKNRLSSFITNISAMSNLSMLDLSKNNIMTLPPSLQAHIDTLLQNGIHVNVRLQYTPLLCNCDSLQFLHWMTKSKAFQKPLKLYYCITCSSRTDRQMINDSYRETLKNLTGKCVSHTIIFCIVASATIALFFSVIGFILYRHRWNIRYLYFAAYNRYLKNRGQTDMSFENDAFVCYAQEDCEFAEHVLDRELNNRGLKVFLHGRDFKAGEYVTSNIVRAVCSSKTTLVLLTQSLMDSYWCKYEIEMAKLEGVYTGRQVLIFIIMEDIPKGKLGKDLAYSIKNNTYMEYPQSVANPNQLKIWWDKLASDIQG